MDNTLIIVTGRTKRFEALVFLHNRRANMSHLPFTGLTLAHRLRPSIKLALG